MKILNGLRIQRTQKSQYIGQNTQRKPSRWHRCENPATSADNVYIFFLASLTNAISHVFSRFKDLCMR